MSKRVGGVMSVIAIAAAMGVGAASAEAVPPSTLVAYAVHDVNAIFLQPGAFVDLSVGGGAGARLTDGDGAPLAGRTITFSTEAGPLCEGTTDAHGRARCDREADTILPGWVAIVLDSGYTATFAGDAGHLGATDRAPLVRVNDEDGLG